MGLFSKLFGSGLSGSGAKSQPKAEIPKAEIMEYNGYQIEPRPFRQGGHYVTAGVIRKDFADGAKEQEFIRADTHVSFDDACAHAARKAEQIIDEQGDRLFDR